MVKRKTNDYWFQASATLQRGDEYTAEEAIAALCADGRNAEERAPAVSARHAVRRLVRPEGDDVEGSGQAAALVFLHPGPQPFQTHLCDAGAVRLVLGGAADGEPLVSSDDQLLVFARASGSAFAAEPITEAPFLFLGKATFASASYGDGGVQTCLRLKFRQPPKLNAALCERVDIRGCRKNKYGSHMCDLEAGEPEETDARPITPPAQPLAVDDEAGEARDDGTMDDLKRLVPAIRPLNNGTSLHVTWNDLSADGAAILRASFADERGAAHKHVTKLTVMMPDERSPALLRSAMAAGTMTAVNVTTMHLFPPIISDHFFAALGQGVAHADCAVTTLTVSCCAMSDRGRAALCDGLRASTKLHVVDFQNCSLAAEALAELSRAVLASGTVRRLKISGNKCTDDGCAAVCAAIRELCPSLESLDVSEQRQADGKLRAGAAAALSELLRDESCKLSSLDVGRTNIGKRDLPLLIDAVVASKTLVSFAASSLKIDNALAAKLDGIKADRPGFTWYK